MLFLEYDMSNKKREEVRRTRTWSTIGSTFKLETALMGTPKDPKAKAAIVPVNHPHDSLHCTIQSIQDTVNK